METTLTALVYAFLGLYGTSSIHLFVPIAPAVLLGLPLGSYLIRYMDSETFRRICMSFDAWIVGFGLARTIIELKLLGASAAYGIWGAVIIFDLCLLFQYFVIGRFRVRSSAVRTMAVELPAQRIAGL